MDIMSRFASKRQACDSAWGDVLSEYTDLPARYVKIESVTLEQNRQEIRKNIPKLTEMNSTPDVQLGYTLDGQW